MDVKTRVSALKHSILSLRPSPLAILLTIQLLGVLSFLIGVSWLSIPAALMIGGILAVIAVERQQSAQAEESHEADDKIRQAIDSAIHDGKNPFSSGKIPYSQKWINYAQLVSRKL